MDGEIYVINIPCYYNNAFSELQLGPRIFSIGDLENACDERSSWPEEEDVGFIPCMISTLMQRTR